jgi:hypothetical protein
MKLRIITAMILSLLIVPALSAQVTSFTSAVTQGLFGTYIDDIQDVNDWSTVDFNNVIGYAGARATGISGGFGTHLGSLFLGVGYSGDLWNGTVTTTTIDGDAADTVPSSGIVTFDNRFDVLLGSGSFGGLKISLALNDFGSDTDKNEVGGADEKQVDTTGSILAGVTWGKNFSLGGGTLKPEFGLTGTFALASIEITDGVANSSSTTKNPADNYTQIALRAAADYEFAPNGNATTTLSGEYIFGIRLKPGTVYEGKNDSASGLYGTTFGASDFESSDKGAYITNDLNLGYKQSYDIDRNTSVAWKAGAELGFDFRETKYSGTQTIAGVTSDIDQKGTATTVFSVSPLAAAAVTYKFAGKPFSVNAGVGIRAGLTITSVENKDFTPTTKRVETTYAYNDLTPNFAIGGTLSPSDSLLLDLRLTGATNIGNFTFIFDANNIVVAFLLGFKM